MYVAYYRRRKPAELDSQREAVAPFRPVVEFIEIETDRGSDRSELAKAIARAKELGATLVIAKLGRLVRNARVMGALMASGIDFICCDNPNANKNTVHILAAVAEDETLRARQRMKDAAALAKSRGEALGSARPEHWRGREHKRGWRQAVAAASKKRATEASDRYKFLMPEIKRRREEGQPLPEIVDWLNNNGHLTTAMKPFTQTALWRIIKRYLGDEYLGRINSKDHPLHSEGA